MGSCIRDTSAAKRLRTWLFAVSLLCSSAWTFAMRSGATESRTESSGYVVTLAATAAVFVIVAALLSSSKRAIAQSRTIKQPCVAICGVVLCALSTIQLTADAQTGLYAPVAIASTVFITLLTIAQFEACCAFDYRSMIVSSAAAFVAAGAVVALLQIETMPQRIIVCLLPLVASATLIPCLGFTEKQDIAPQNGTMSASCTQTSTNEEKRHERLSPMVRSAAGLCTMMFILGFAHDNARIGYLSILAETGTSTPVSGLVTYGVVVAVMVGGITLLCLRKRRSAANGLKPCFHIVVIALAASQLLPLLSFDSSIHTSLILPMHMGVFRGMIFFLWILVLQVQSNSRVLLYCLSQATLDLGSVAGVSAWNAAYSASANTTFFFPLMLASTLGLLLAYVTLFTDKDLERLVAKSTQATILKESDEWPEGNAENEGGGKFIARCEATAQAYGLSPRETEIMILFAKGRNLEYIHNNLVISKSTVSMHRQHIYRKLDVHSQQEMIDLIERQDS